MALNVASLLDGAALGVGTLEKAMAGMNKVMAIKNIALEHNEQCSVICTIGGRSYAFSTQQNGVLQVSAVAGADLTKALARADARCVLDAVAFNNEAGNESEAWEDPLKDRRKMWVDGDGRKYALLHNVLLDHMFSLQAAAPPVTELREEDWSVSLDIWKGLEAPSWQVATLQEDGYLPPLGANFRGWLMFSAVSTMTGNMGQTNYSASNQVMDALTFSARQVRGAHCFEPITIMWGTVGHMGMRWKAFGSADFIYSAAMGGEDIVMIPSEAAQCLGIVFAGVSPEWMVANKFDSNTYRVYMSGGAPQPVDPWGWMKKKGKGGGSDVCEEGTLPEFLQPLEKKTKPVDSGKSAHEGRRVRLQRLEKSQKMNGKKGTLLEKLEDGNWVVRLDGGLGDKILKVTNMDSLSGMPLEA